MAASRMQLSCNGRKGRARRRLVSLPPWRCCLVIYAQVPASSRTFAWLFTRLPDEIHLVMAQIRRQIPCKWTKRRATWSIVALLPWQCCLATCQQVYSRPQGPSHWSSPPYVVFISSGLRALYRCPLRGPPLSPARRTNGSCKCVRS